MSKPAPPKPNILTTILWSIMIFMTFQLLFNRPQNANQKSPTAAEIFGKMQLDNQERLDNTIVQDYSDYENALSDLVQKKLLTPAQAEEKKIPAVILVADTQLKAGIHSNQTNRIRNAFGTLASYQRRLLDQPSWNTVYPVADVSRDKLFGWRQWSGQQLYEKVRETLAFRNQTEPVWGFIPGYQIVDALVSLTGRIPAFSYAFAAFLLALLVRAIIFPLAQKQIMYGRQMSQLGPLVKEIKDRYKDDQMVSNQKVMELYKEYGVNPMAGCAPAMVQMPFFFAIYQCMLHYQFTFEKGTFLWMNPSTSIATHGFTAANLGQMDAILTIIYGITMIVSSMLTPISDPTQVKQQRVMGVVLAFVWTGMMFSGRFPVVSGFVLYWTFTNCLSTAQMLRAYRLPLPPLVKVNAPGGGVRPQAGGKWAKWFEEMQRQAAEQVQQSSNAPNGKYNGSANGSSNGKPNPTPSTFLGTGETKTGTPQKHKPKKRK